MPKLLLIQPPIEDFYDTDIRLQPLGLASLKAALRRWLPELEVKIVDFHHGWGRKTVPVPAELRYLREYYEHRDKSPFASFHQYFHFGADEAAMRRCLEEEAPDAVGISSLFSPYYREALRCAELVKEVLGVPVILGGSHVSACPELMLGHEAVDFVIRGEGEKPLVQWCARWLASGLALESADWSGVSNLGYKKSGKLHFNPLEENYPLEELPIPDFGDFSCERYAYEKRPLAFLVTSRSCPHRCSFCSVHTTFGFRYRRRSVAQVLEEIETRYGQGYRVLDFEDDNLTFYREEMEQLCHALIARFAPGELTLLAMNGISYLSLDPELLALMRQAGFTHLNLALVSSDHSVRESTKRPHTVKKYLEIVEAAQSLGLQVVSYQILGLPQESLESMMQTLSFAARLPVLIGASLFYLTPNSPLARELNHPVTEENVFKARLTAMAIETDNFRREDLYSLFVTTRIVDFLKSLTLPRAEIDFSELLEGSANLELGARERVGMELLRRFFESGVLEAATSEGYRPLKRFKAEVFHRVWSQCGEIVTQRNQRIRLAPAPVAACRSPSAAAQAVVG